MAIRGKKKKGLPPAQMSGEVEFIDAEQFSGGSTDAITMQMIILEQIRRIIRFGSTEFKKGYFAKVTTPSGATLSEKWNADQREEFSHAVDVLADTLLPFFDEQMKKVYFMLTAESENLRTQHITKADLDSYKTEKLLIKKKLYIDIVDL